MYSDKDNVVVAALYKFVRLEDHEQMRDPLKAFAIEQGIRGTLLLADEGINGTIAGSREGIDAVLHYLRKDKRLEDLEHKESFVDEIPFNRMKVRLKREIVTLGVEGVDPSKCTGKRVSPKEWNDLLKNEDVYLIDTRNDYEVELGTFEGAVDPKTDSFRQFPDFVKKEVDPEQYPKVAMFCTGGIRCEKASAYMLEQGFSEVYQLEGGILKYLEEIPEEESLWRGECFVFDDRVSVDHSLSKGTHAICYACGETLSAEEKTSRFYEEGLSCPKCFGKLSALKQKSAQDRHDHFKRLSDRQE